MPKLSVKITAPHLASAFADLNCYPTSSQQQQLQAYLTLLARWNRVHNLTAVREQAQMWPKHIFDSLSVLPYLQATRLLDVGSGAGLPGIPIAIMQPELPITLLDSVLKRCHFMQQACIELNLKNVTVVQTRVETWQTKTLFDGIISRAFATPNNFIKTSALHLQTGGLLYAMQGKKTHIDLPKGFVLKQNQRLSVPYLTAERHLQTIRKQP